jgi:hypothetical protein
MFVQDPMNLKNMRENASVYRNRRLLQDITGTRPLDPVRMAFILRDQRGLNGTDIGMGNEKAMNQLIAHHSVIFEPEKRLAWVSTSPWQSGPYVCYNLTEIFHKFAALQSPCEIVTREQEIQQDPFLSTHDYQQFLQFREMRKTLKQAIGSGKTAGLPASFVSEFRNTNPNYYEVFELIGDYYASEKKPGLARENYRKALQMEVPRWSEKLRIIKN